MINVILNVPTLKLRIIIIIIIIIFIIIIIIIIIMPTEWREIILLTARLTKI